MLAPAKPQTRVGVFDLAVPTRVGRPRRRRPENRRAKPSPRRRLASKPCFGANGELQTKTDASGTTEYTYDSFGNLRNVTPPAGSAVDYVIDGMNRRVGRKVGGTLVQGLLYQNHLNAVAVLDGAGNLVAQYAYGTKGNVPDVKTDGTGSYRILSDHVGSPRLVVNTADGTVVERTDFDEWGNVTADNAPGTTPFGFAGGLYEASTGLVRFGARDYEAASGRWTSKDPIRFNGGQPNIYVYIGDDPINTVDANGEGPFGDLLCQLDPLLCDKTPPQPGGMCMSNGSESDPEALQQCYDACDAGGAALYQYCSENYTGYKFIACRALVFGGNVACRNWCYWQHGE